MRVYPILNNEGVPLIFLPDGSLSFTGEVRAAPTGDGLVIGLVNRDSFCVNGEGVLRLPSR